MCRVFCDLPVKLFACTTELDDDVSVESADRLIKVAHVLGAIGFITLLAGAVLGVLILAGATLSFLVGLSLPLFVGALAVSAVAFGLSYIASASAVHAYTTNYDGYNKLVS